jgi:hypothetical protein
VIAPFRIGTTSFVYPARWLANVERLAGRVDDVEILLFELAGDAPGPDELAALEVFREADFEASLALLHRWLGREAA